VYRWTRETYIKIKCTEKNNYTRKWNALYYECFSGWDLFQVLITENLEKPSTLPEESVHLCKRTAVATRPSRFCTSTSNVIVK